ncbi:MAG: hypothetical protein CMM46_13670 [Rhodospirillaceae bacterium]|nr:hypothetical protein [Rhodospirillaceae bacterium]
MARLDPAIHLASSSDLPTAEDGSPIKWGDEDGGGMLILKRALIAVVFALGLVAMPSRADTIASYSIVAHDPVEDATVLLVRVIVDGAESSCPSFEVNGQSVDAASRYNPDANVVALPVAMEVDGQATTGWVSALLGTADGFGSLTVDLADAAEWQGALSSFAPDGTAAAVPLMTCAMPVRDGDVCAPPAP